MARWLGWLHSCSDGAHVSADSSDPTGGPLLLAAGLTLLQTALELAAPWPLKLVVDNALGGEPLERWLDPLGGLSALELTAVAATAIVALAAVSGVLAYGVTYLVGAAAERIGADLRCAAFGALQRRSLHFQRTAWTCSRARRSARSSWGTRERRGRGEDCCEPLRPGLHETARKVA